MSKLIAASNLTEQIAQLTNKAPSMEQLGVPAYNWLSDDEHGVRGWRTTYFPDGPGLGASFDKQLLYEVGEVRASNLASAPRPRGEHGAVHCTHGQPREALRVVPGGRAR